LPGNISATSSTLEATFSFSLYTIFARKGENCLDKIYQDDFLFIGE
jgi:hypothetical protein